MAETVDAEGAIRLYLMYLDDPTKLQDPATIKRLTAEYEKATDPVDKLKARGALRRAEAVDGSEHEANFIKYAKDWAAGNGVSAEDFRELGVSDDVLKAAGVLVSRRGRGAGGGASAVKKPRAPRVSTDAIREHILSEPGRFAIADVVEGFGGSPASVKKVIDELVTDGKVKNLGAKEDHASRGRAPTVYATVQA